MRDWASFARFGEDDKEIRDYAGNLTPNPFPWGKGNNRVGGGIVA